MKKALKKKGEGGRNANTKKDGGEKICILQLNWQHKHLPPTSTPIEEELEHFTTLRNICNPSLFLPSGTDYMLSLGMEIASEITHANKAQD